MGKYFAAAILVAVLGLLSSAPAWAEMITPSGRISGAPVVAPLNASGMAQPGEIAAPLQNFFRVRADAYRDFVAGGRRLTVNTDLNALGVRSVGDLTAVFAQAEKVANARVAFLNTYYRNSPDDNAIFERNHRNLLFPSAEAMRGWFINMKNIFAGIGSPNFNGPENDLMFSTGAERVTIIGGSQQKMMGDKPKPYDPCANCPKHCVGPDANGHKFCTR